jgi:hypothetical protein
LIQKNDAADHAKILRDKEVVIATLEQNVWELENMISNKNDEVGGLKQKLEGVCPVALLKESQDRHQQMMTRYKATEQNLENKVAEL